MSVRLLRVPIMFLFVALAIAGCATAEGTAVPSTGGDGDVAGAPPAGTVVPTGATAAAAVPGTVYGAGVTLDESIPVSELVTNVDRYVGRTVRVEGIVTGVCARRGCWIELASDRDFETVRVKVEDGVIVFPVSARGQYAVAEGVVTRTDYDLEGARDYLRHRAEESGEPFDPDSVTGPMTLVGLAGSGAVIRESR